MSVNYKKQIIRAIDEIVDGGEVAVKEITEGVNAIKGIDTPMKPDQEKIAEEVWKHYRSEIVKEVKSTIKVPWWLKTIKSMVVKLVLDQIVPKLLKPILQKTVWR